MRLLRQADPPQLPHLEPSQGQAIGHPQAPTEPGAGAGLRRLCAEGSPAPEDVQGDHFGGVPLAALQERASGLRKQNGEAICVNFGQMFISLLFSH